MMNWCHPVTPSGFIALVGWDSDTGTIGIKMHAGKEYFYPGATSNEYIEVLNAPSTGSAFAKFKKEWTARQAKPEPSDKENADAAAEQR